MSQYRVGYLFFKGKGVPKSEPRSLPFLTQAMIQGSSAARRRVARIYFNEDNGGLMDWGLGAAALMLSQRPSKKDYMAYKNRLALNWTESKSGSLSYELLLHHRLAELYQYGRAEWVAPGRWSAMESTEFALPMRIYELSVSMARKATITVLGLRRRRHGSLWATLPRDMINIVSRMIFETRILPHHWVVGAESLLGVSSLNHQQEQGGAKKAKRE